ncbi:hypothetical protein ACLOJK_011233 [Asimina triloba]
MAERLDDIVENEARHRFSTSSKASEACGHTNLRRVCAGLSLLGRGSGREERRVASAISDIFAFADTLLPSA